MLLLYSMIVSLHPTQVCTLDSDWQGTKVPQTYMQRYNICNCRSYGLSVELHLSSFSLVAISRKISWKMPSPPTLPHDVQVKLNEGQAILMWTIGALVYLLHLESYLKIKRPSTASVSLHGNGCYAFLKHLEATDECKSITILLWLPCSLLAAQILSFLYLGSSPTIDQPNNFPHFERLLSQPLLWTS